MENKTAAFRLSPQQEYVWSLQQEGAPLLVACALTLEGCVGSEQVRAALQRVIAPNEILRTVFQRPKGVKVPFQVILEKSEFAWSESDESHLGCPDNRIEGDSGRI